MVPSSTPSRHRSAVQESTQRRYSGERSPWDAKAVGERRRAATRVSSRSVIVERNGLLERARAGCLEMVGEDWLDVRCWIDDSAWLIILNAKNVWSCSSAGVADRARRLSGRFVAVDADGAIARDGPASDCMSPYQQLISSIGSMKENPDAGSSLKQSRFDDRRSRSCSRGWRRSIELKMAKRMLTKHAKWTSEMERS